MKSLAIFLTIALTSQFATPALADWYYAPPVVHHHHDDNSAAWGLGGLAVGLILGAAMADSEKGKAKPKEPTITDIEERLTAFSAQALIEAQKAITRYGIDDGLAKINEYWQGQSYDTIYDPIGLKLSITDSKNLFKMTYIIDKMAREVDVIVIHRPSGKSSSRHGSFNAPDSRKTLRQSNQDNTASRNSLDLLGFSLSDKRSNGYLTVAEVEEGTAAYYVGLRAGTPIVAIDDNKTTQMMHDQMDAYVLKRAETGNTIRVQFKTNGGVLKTAVIKPKL